MITINDIARMANVSRTTVSRVLNGNGNVQDEMKKRVLKVIEETGYIPSESAKSLRTKQTNIIGVIIPRLTSETMNRFLDHFGPIIQEKGYQMILYNTELDIDKEVKAFSVLESRRVDAILHFATNTKQELKDAINATKVPVLVVGQDLERQYQIVTDDKKASKLLCKELLDREYTHIGFIGVNEQDRAVGYLRKQGFIEFLKEHNIRINENWIRTANFDFNSGYHTMAELLEQKSLPNAIVCVTDRIALGAMQCIVDHGYEVPKDIAVCGMGASAIAFYSRPHLTTIDFKNEEQGEIAANLLLQLLEQEDKTASKNIIIEPSLILGDSI